MSAPKICTCGHRRSPAHPLAGKCYDNLGTVNGVPKRCPCKKFQEAAK